MPIADMVYRVLLRGRLGAQVHAGTDNHINLVSDMMKKCEIGTLPRRALKFPPTSRPKRRPPMPCCIRVTAPATIFLGWVHLPSSISENEIDAIRKEAAKLRSKADVVVCIGIGGSYLGAKAVLEAMSDPFKLLHKEQKHPTVLFAGQNISEDYTAELLDAVKEHSIAAIVISKSGTTTEPAIPFPLIKGRDREALRQEGGCGAHRGHHRQGARSVEDARHAGGISDVRHSRRRGRTFLGADPRGTAAAGRRRRGHRGARPRRAGDGEGHGRRRCFQRRIRRPSTPPCATSSTTEARRSRFWVPTNLNCNISTSGGNSSTARARARQQGKGIFPASVTLTADLHSMGQYIQDGERTLFETIISVAKPAAEVLIEADKGENLDGLNFLAGKRISEVNRMAELGVQLAHVDGGVPNIRIEIPEISERVIGGLLYFFERPAASRLYAGRESRSTSRASRPTRRTCSPCWTNPATRRLRKLSRPGSDRPSPRRGTASPEQSRLREEEALPKNRTPEDKSPRTEALLPKKL